MAATAEDMLLCRLTGELWAIFAPWRGPWNGGGATAAYQGRRAFGNRAGLRWRNKGRDRDEREAILSVLGQLERSGLLVRRIEQTRVVAVRLSDAGIERACSLAGAPCWSAGWQVCRRLVECDDRRAWMMHLGTRWTAEWALAGTPPQWAQCGSDEAGRANRRLLSELEEAAIPALVRGWMESGADMHGRAWYSFTDAGAAALAETPAEAPLGIDADEDCALAWREGAHAMQIRLAAAPRSEREIGLLPLPAHDAQPYTYATARQEFCDYAKYAAAAAHLATRANVGDDVGPRSDVPTVGGRGGVNAAHLGPRARANVGGDMAATGAADSGQGSPPAGSRRRVDARPDAST
ncbi:MAG: hypothetical protein KJZ69_17580 [Phycisphaerales bacterium]|nr:hypothetical protein [Phycisphaerales bacterium]